MNTPSNLTRSHSDPSYPTAMHRVQTINLTQPNHPRYHHNALGLLDSPNEPARPRHPIANTLKQLSQSMNSNSGFVNESEILRSVIVIAKHLREASSIATSTSSNTNLANTTLRLLNSFFIIAIDYKDDAHLASEINNSLERLTTRLIDQINNDPEFLNEQKINLKTSLKNFISDPLIEEQHEPDALKDRDYIIGNNAKLRLIDLYEGIQTEEPLSGFEKAYTHENTQFAIDQLIVPFAVTATTIGITRYFDQPEESNSVGNELGRYAALTAASLGITYLPKLVIPCVNLCRGESQKVSPSLPSAAYLQRSLTWPSSHHRANDNEGVDQSASA